MREFLSIDALSCFATFPAAATVEKDDVVVVVGATSSASTMQQHNRICSASADVRSTDNCYSSYSWFVCGEEIVQSLASQQKLVSPCYINRCSLSLCKRNKTVRDES